LDYIIKEAVYKFPSSTEEIVAYRDETTGLRIYEIPNDNGVFGSHLFFKNGVSNHKCTYSEVQNFELELLGSQSVNSDNEYATFKMPDVDGKISAYRNIRTPGGYYHEGVIVSPKIPKLVW
jgi:hypothetical protein